MLAFGLYSRSCATPDAQGMLSEVLPPAANAKKKRVQGVLALASRSGNLVFLLTYSQARAPSRMRRANANSKSSQWTMRQDLENASGSDGQP